MRIDEIDLIGLVKVSGATSGSGQVLSYTETGLNWATASSVASTSTIKKSGYNYIIVETVKTGDSAADAIQNKIRFDNAYNEAKTNFIGTPSVTNRFTILLMPGVYDFAPGGSSTLDTSFIDVIGFSSNRKSVLLQHTGGDPIFRYGQNVDSKLENISSDSHMADNSETGQYLRWKNLYFFGYDPFAGAFSEINGEFEDIKCVGVGFANNVKISLNGIFKNIESTGSSFTMTNDGNPTLTGTFSNILIKDPEFAFSSVGASISGTFENIKISPNVGGTLEAFLASTLGSSTSVFKDIEIVSTNNMGSLFSSTVGDISGTFKNISVKSLSVNAFMNSFTSILGTFDNINLNDSPAFFTSNGNIIGDFTNIIVGNVGNIFADNSFANEISGTFENIEVGNVDNNIFYTLTLGGIFKNIEIKSGGFNSNSFYTNGSLSGTFQNINILDGTEFLKCLYSETTMTATFKNININKAGGDVLWSYLDMNLDCEDITITSSGTIDSIFSSSTESIYGTYKNINLAGPFTDAFVAGIDLNINLKNLRYSNINNNGYIFTSSSGDIYGTYEDIFCDVGPGNVFYNSSGDINIHVKNMDIAGKNRLEIIPLGFSSIGTLSGTFQNIRLGQLTSNCFCAGTPGASGVSWVDILVDDLVITRTYAPAFTPLTLFGASSYLKGTFSNIDVAVTPPGTFSSTNFAYIFRAGGDVTTGKNDVYCKNIRLGRVNPYQTIDQGGIFYQGASVSNVYLENFVADSQVSPTVQLSGKIISSEIDQTAWSQRNLRVATGTIIEKSTILGSASNIGITGSHQSTYTIVSANTPGNIFGATPGVSNYNILRTSPL